MRSVAEPVECGLCRARGFQLGVVRRPPARPDAWVVRDSKAFATTPIRTAQLLRWSAESRLSAAAGTSSPATAAPQVNVLERVQACDAEDLADTAEQRARGFSAAHQR